MLGKTLFDTPALIDFHLVQDSKSYHDAVVEGSFLGLNSFNPGTQKARGIFFLQGKQNSIQNVFYQWSVPKHLLFSSGLKFDDGSFNFPVFARPCPVNPRHGFVDSTLCNNAEELNKVSAAAYSAEEDAELLITKPVNSLYNAIINGSVITFSDGNDGATAGRNCKYFYISEDPISNILGLNEKDVIASDEIPFYEFVFAPPDEHRLVKLVQVRSAPKTPRVKDFVPSQVTVKTILKAEGDLLDWEALLKTVDPKTTIVDHTNGSLSSHYAIHAIVNGVAIFTTYLPEKGSVVEPTVENTAITDEDRKKFFEAFASGFTIAKSIVNKGKYQSNEVNLAMGNIIRMSLATLHNFSSLALSKDYQLLGMVIGLFCRTAFAISIGETRYNAKRSDKFPFSINYFNELPKGGRTACYDYSLEISNDQIVKKIVTAYRIFSEMKWDNSYGGKRWAQCTNSAVSLFNACVNMDINKVVELFNVVINENHNGGRYLNKVVNGMDFDKASMQPSNYALENFHYIVDILSVAWDESKGITQHQIENIKEISLTWETDKSVPTSENKINNIYISATNADYIKEIVVVNPNTQEHHKIQLPQNVPNYKAGECSCDSCVPSGKFELHSIPFWIVMPNGSRVISKSQLSKSLEKLGLLNLKLG